MAQQRVNVLADVVIARAFPEFFGMPIVVLQREAGDFLQVLRMQFHIHPTRATVCLALAARPCLFLDKPEDSLRLALLAGFSPAICVFYRKSRVFVLIESICGSGMTIP